MSFNWQTEESGWDEVSPVEEPQVKTTRRRWPWVAGLLLGLLLVASLLVYQQLRQRVTVATEQAEANLLASHEVIHRAASNNDRELFTTFVSGRDPQWAEAQERAIAGGTFFARGAYGLAWLPADEPGAVQINLSPDLSAAEVVSEERYAVDIGSGLTQTVNLRHTAVYRLGPNRWLLSPPEAEFWGEAKLSQDRILALSYPERDEPIARKLALDIDAKLMEMCGALADLECPADFRIGVVFSTDPQSLNEAALAHVLVRDGDVVQLPAPTLLGVPVDEAGYQALYRGYAAQVAAAAITNLVEWDCCSHALFYQALLAHQLRRLALWPWPLTGDDYEGLTQYSLEAIGDTWSDTDMPEQVGNSHPHLALTEFLIQESGAPVATIQRALAQTSTTSADYWDWLFQFATGANTSTMALEREWFRFVYNRSTTAQTPPPLPLPEQDLQLLCRPFTGQSMTLYRYDLATESLTFAGSVNGPGFMIGLPDDAGVVVGELEPGASASGRRSMFLLEDGVKTTISWGRTGTPVALPAMVDPAGTFLLLSSLYESELPSGLLNLPSCRRGDSCDLTVISGFPVWSPDGRHAILVRAEASQVNAGHPAGALFLSDDQGQDPQFLVSGAAPFWLDEETFGFIMLNRVSLAEGIYITTVDEATAEPQMLLGADELAAALPESQQPESLHVDHVAVAPTNPDLLLIATADPLGQSSHGYLFAYDRETGEISIRLQIEDEPRQYVRGYRFSPDGRWLVISSLKDSEPERLIYLHNVESGDTLTFIVNDAYRWSLPWYIDWTEGNQWFSLPEQGYIRLIAPDYDYERLVIPEDRICTGAAWVNKD